MDSDDDVMTAFQERGTADRTPERLLPQQLELVTDLILVADDERRYVDVNRAAVTALGRPKEAIVGRSIDDFFSEADREPIPDVWEKFVAAGDRYGTCKLRGMAGATFVYRSRANVMPGLHVAVLRRIK